MTLGSGETQWVHSTFESCQVEACRPTVVSIDMMGWLVLRGDCTWRELSLQFCNYIQSFIESYPTATRIYFSVDTVMYNDAKAITQHRRNMAKESQSTASVVPDSDLWFPTPDSMFSNRLFRSDKKWRVQVLFSWLNDTLDQFVVLNPALILIFSGLADPSTPVVNTLMVRKSQSETIRTQTRSLMVRYKEGDQRQLYFLLSHPGETCLAVNRDGDLFTGCLLYLQDHSSLNQVLFWQSPRFLYNINDCLALVGTNRHLGPQPAVALSKLIFARGNDYVHIPLRYVSLATLWATSMTYPAITHDWIYDDSVGAFSRLAALCYCFTPAPLILKPAIPIEDYIDVWLMPHLNKTKRPPPTERYRRLNARSPKPLPILLNNETNNAIVTMETNKGMLHPRLLATLCRQINFTVAYNRIFAMTDPGFANLPAAFAKDSNGKSIHGYTEDYTLPMIAVDVPDNPFEAWF